MVRFELDLDTIYPIGSIYMSINDINPKVYYGGEWERIEDKFLLACGTKHPNGSTGGEEKHTLTKDEMPSHTHTQNNHNHDFGPDSTYKVPRTHNDNWGYSSPMNITHTSGSNYWVYSTSNRDGIAEISNTASTTATNQNAGGGQAHNNMPPFLAVYMWVRTG